MGFLSSLGVGTIFLLVLVFILFTSSVKVVQEYERGVIFRLGRLMGAKGPGLFFIIPGIDRMMKIDLRVITMVVDPQEVITRDNVTVKVNAVVYFKVVDPNMAVVKVMDYIRATSQVCQTTLRSVLGQSDLDTLLSQRDQINGRLQQIIDEQTEPWGVKVSVVEVKDVELPQSMQRAMAKQAEAEREKRAKVIHAQGEFDASARLADAADMLNRSSTALQLRYLQTLTEIAVEKNSTIIFPVPIDMVTALMQGSVNRDGHAPPSNVPPAEPPITTE